MTVVVVVGRIGRGCWCFFVIVLSVVAKVDSVSSSTVPGVVVVERNIHCIVCVSAIILIRVVAQLIAAFFIAVLRVCILPLLCCSTCTCCTEDAVVVIVIVLIMREKKHITDADDDDDDDKEKSNNG